MNRDDIQRLQERVRELEGLARDHRFMPEPRSYRTLGEWCSWVDSARTTKIVVVDRWELDEIKELLNKKLTYESELFLRGESLLLRGTALVVRGAVVR